MKDIKRIPRENESPSPMTLLFNRLGNRADGHTPVYIREYSNTVYICDEPFTGQDIRDNIRYWKNLGK